MWCGVVWHFGSGTLPKNFTQRISSRGWRDPKIIVENVSLNIYEHGSRAPVVKQFHASKPFHFKINGNNLGPPNFALNLSTQDTPSQSSEDEAFTS